MYLDLTPDQLALRDELCAYFSGLLSPAERISLLTERHGEVGEVRGRPGRACVEHLLADCASGDVRRQVGCRKWSR